MNKFIFLGNIATDIDLKQLGDKNIATFNVAIQRNYKNKEGKYESDFFRITAYGQQADFINKFFNKGDKILLEGHVQNSSYESNGEKRYTTNYIVEQARFVNGKSEKKENDFISLEDDSTLPF